jgi:CheY-like chemotaxis protein
MKTVLLIDDDNAFLLTIGVRLKSMGYTVHAAKDGVSAISAVRKNNPDVIVLDVTLPAGDGFVVAERLQRLISTAATPIIFVTASEKPGMRERAMKLGAVEFLNKPFDATTLADAIESATGGQRGVTAAVQLAGSLAVEILTICKFKRNSAFFWSTMTQWRFES